MVDPRNENENENSEMARFEAENRVRNLIWTVSGDYNMKVEPDMELFFRSEARGIYHAVVQGGFFRYFDRSAFSLYLLKKLYYQADEKLLGRIARLVMDAAVWERLTEQRRGVRNLRVRACEDFLDREFHHRANHPLGCLELQYYGRAAGGDAFPDPRFRELFAMLEELGRGEPDTGEVIRAVDRIYNTLADPKFETRHGNLEHVLSLTLEDLAEADFDWKEFLAEEAEESAEELPDSGAEVESAGGQGEKQTRATRVVRIDEAMRQKTYAYMEMYYGRSYMDPTEQKRLSLTLCRGIHRGASLLFTDGILNAPVRKNSQYESVKRQTYFNQVELKRNRSLASRNIARLAREMSQAMIRRTEAEAVKSDAGQIRPRECWRVGRTAETRLFTREFRQANSDFVVDILMDASGSQLDRRGSVAVQGYIISEALSQVGIPHRVQSFCTCWDYTILQRFREYDDPREMNSRIMEFSTSANNRDGLAVKTVVHGLLQRPEDNRILIILSDGRPNDRIVNRSGSEAPALYVGDTAVFDTAEEVRRARNQGVAVLGVFAGRESDLEAEKKIFGRDFAYIRNIRNFSHVVGRYLKRQIDNM